MPTSAELLRAISGPVILIAFGTLIAIDYGGGLGFSRTWPVLIILYGLLKLAGSLKGGEQA
jgi:hypothetical protein